MAYNSILCMLINIRGIVRMPQVLLDHRIDHFNIIVCKLVVGFMQRIANSKNGPLKVIYGSVFLFIVICLHPGANWYFSYWHYVSIYLFITASYSLCIIVFIFPFCSMVCNIFII